MRKAEQAEPNLRLKAAREAKGWTQRDVADRIGAPQTFLVTRWERGISRPNKVYLQKLVKLFQKSPEELGFSRQEMDEEVAATGCSLLHLPPSTHANLIMPRQKDVEHVYSLLTHEDTTAVLLTGVSGVGKSTLAALVYNFVEEQRRARNGFFKTKAFWLHIDANSTLIDIAGTILHAMGKSVEHIADASPAQLAAALFGALDTVDTPYLFVLDQFEHLLDIRTGNVLMQHQGISEWLDLLNNQPCTSRLLLTSCVLPRGTYKMPRIHIEPYTLKGLSLTEGMELLRKHGVAGSKAELHEAIERCEGHTYALVLLTSLIQECSLTLSQVLKDATLWIDDIYMEILHQITSNLIAIHFDVLYAFSIYRSAVPVEAIRAVLGHTSEKQILQATRVLIKVHLLQATGDGRFQCHSLVTEYTKSSSRRSGQEIKPVQFQRSHNRAAHYYLQQAVRECPTHESGQRTVTNSYQLIEALWHLSQSEQYQTAYNLLVREALFADLHLRGGDTSLLEIYTSFLPLEKWSCQGEQALEIYTNLGAIHHALGQLDKALNDYGQALLLCRLTGQRDKEWRIHLEQGLIHDDQGRKRQAQQCYEQALKISEATGNLAGRAYAFSSLGWSANNDGDSDQGQRYLEQALPLFQQVGDKDGMGWALTRLGAVAKYLGAYEQAHSYYTRARELFHELGNLSGEAWTLDNIGDICIYLEQHERAIGSLEKGLDIFRAVKGLRGSGWILYRLGQTYISLKNAEKAWECEQQALEIFKEVGDQVGQGVCLGKLGEIHALQKQYARATRCYSQGLSLLRMVKDHRGEAEILVNLGILYREQRLLTAALAACLLAKMRLQNISNSNELDVNKQIQILHSELEDTAYDEVAAQPEDRLIAFLDP